MTDAFPNIDLSVLTDRQRLVIVLHYYNNWTYAEIARGLFVKECTARSHARYARSRLKGAMSP